MSRRAGASGPAFWGDADDGEARQRYQTLVNAIDDGIYHLDAEGRVVAVNDVLVDLTGRAREDLVGESVAALFDGGDAEAIERELDRLSADAADRRARLDLSVRTDEGGRVPCEVRLTALGSDDALDGSVGIVRETDGRSEAERPADESAEAGRSSDGVERGGGRERGADGERAMDRQRVVTALEAAREGVSLLDEDGAFAYVNDAYAETFGYDPDEMIGERWDDLGIEADPDRMREEIIPVVREEGRWAGTTTCVRSDGSQFRSQHSLVSTGGGELICLVRDVTDRTERERELQRTERRFEAMFEDPNVLVGLLEPDGTVIDINETAMEYVDAGLADVRGDLFWETPWWGEGVRADVREWTERAAAGEYVEFQADLTRPDGERYVLEGYFRPVTDEDGEVVSIIVSDRDVTERKERERQLTESERRYRTLAEYFPNGLVTLFDRDLEYTLAAGQGFDRIPIRPGDLEGKQFSEAWDEQTAEALEPLFEGALDGEERSVELEYAGRDWVVHGVPITDERGEVFAGMTMALDITERKEQQREIRRSERRYRTLVENFPEGSVGLFDENLEYTAVGGRLLDRLDLSPDDRIGRSVSEIHSEELLDDIEPYFRAALDGERNSFEIEFRGRHLYANALPVGNAEDGVSAGMVVVQDVTERREAQRELRESEAKFRMLAENLDEIVWMASADAEEFTYINPAFEEVWGLQREALYDDSTAFLDAVHPDDRERVREAFGALPDRAFDEEFRIRRPDGQSRWVHARGASVRDDSGMERVVGIGEDVTKRVERERELERSERRYRTVVENFPNGAVGLVDRDLRYVTIGGHPLTESDLTADELVGRSIRDVLSPNLADRLVPVYQSALDGEPATLEYEYDGGDRHTRFRAFPVRDDDGEVFGAMGMSQDITEQVERERRLEESERRYRTLAENFPNGAVAVYDEDLRFTLTRGAELGDVLPERTELEGRRVPEVFPPDIVADLEPLLRAAVEDGESDSDTFEFGGRHWRTRATPLRDADGEIFAGLSFSQDITEQVEREAELERALDLLERTERIADVGGWEVDPETRDVFWSEHIFDLLEVDADEEPPLDEALDMYHAADRPTVESAIDDALASGEPFDVEVRLRTAASGEVRWLRLQGVPETEDGDIETLRGAVQDVTERVEREAELEELIERLEESNERLEQFAYAASHDLQEPLRMVSSYLQLVERRYAADLDEDGREFISYAVDGADRMREMIEGLLQYSRVDTRGDPFEPVDLDAVFADVRDDLQVRIEETGAEITAEDLPRVSGDGGQLRQVFQNLLDNAIEYSGDDSPRVHVSAERAGDRWEISVSDEGIGIDPDDADRAFEVFQSLHSREDHAGTGIGLALCERVVERHGGDIRVDSEPGAGSTFTFTLPAIGEHSARP